MIKSNILIVDNFSLNAGDIGILMVIVELIRKEFPNSNIFIEASHPAIIGKFKDFLGIGIYPRIFDIQFLYSDLSMFRKLEMSLVGFYDLFSFLIWSLARKVGLNLSFLIRKNRRKQAEVICGTDLIISAGGGFLSSNYNYGFRLYIYLIAIILKKKIVIFPQSIGPFKSVFSRQLIPLFLNRMDRIFLREPYSERYLKKFNISTDMVTTADMAFLLEKKNAKSIEDVFNKHIKKAAICIKSDLNKGKNNNYRNSMEKIIGSLLKKDYTVYIISHTIGDDSLGRKLFNKFNKNRLYFIPFGRSPKMLKQLYSFCSFVIASRMHAAIFAAECKVPVVIISYEQKFIGLVKQLDWWDELLIDYCDIDYKLLEKAIYFIKENEVNIRKKLEKRVEILKKDALIPIDYLKRYIK